MNLSAVARAVAAAFSRAMSPGKSWRVPPYLSREGTYRTGLPLYGIPYSARASSAIVLAARAADFYSLIRERAVYTEVAAVLRRTLGDSPILFLVPARAFVSRMPLR